MTIRNRAVWHSYVRVFKDKKEIDVFRFEAGMIPTIDSESKNIPSVYNQNDVQYTHGVNCDYFTIEDDQGTLAYDSRYKIIHFEEYEVEDRECPHCLEIKPYDEFVWVNDHNGYAYKKVCPECFEEVQREIRHYEDGEDGTPNEPDYAYGDYWE